MGKEAVGEKENKEGKKCEGKGTGRRQKEGERDT